MILGVFITLAALSGLLVVLGYTTGDSAHALVGFFFFFLLGLILLGSGIQYHTGDVTTTNYTYSANATLNQTTTTTRYTYDNFSGNDSHWFGFLLALLGGFGFALQMYNWRNH